MIVKVCGVRTVEIAEVAVDAGADWLGLVFEPRSVRCVDDSAARAVADAVRRRADLVGVFVSPSVEETDSAAQRYRLAAVQVHGDADPGFAARSSVPVIRGVNVRSLGEALRAAWWPDCLALLDAAPETPDALPGGTGTRLDLRLAAEVAAHRPIILAGGLSPDSVAGAISVVGPEGVDASSGLESSPGVKDASLVERFVRAARGATVPA
jgi:phosphoribosylanthranilate isomerase